MVQGLINFFRIPIRQKPYFTQVRYTSRCDGLFVLWSSDLCSKDSVLTCWQEFLAATDDHGGQATVHPREPGPLGGTKQGWMTSLYNASRSVETVSDRCSSIQKTELNIATRSENWTESALAEAYFRPNRVPQLKAQAKQGYCSLTNSR
jgi:hypothetical protein